ncbi:MAG TPA: alpha/beta hydrolase domain-containing protein [Aliidongia sp.]|nr:alpha/beta hydrolase domain-containing protein [Aliidongia sp.]
MRRLTILALSLLQIGTARAAVDHIEILDRQPFAAGTEFGATGAYEKIRARAFFAIDPELSANAGISDVALAPLDAQGKVEFSADFLMLRPVDAARGNGTLLYDVVNRGNPVMLGQLDEAPSNLDPSSAADAGNGFLFKRGFTLLWSAWQWDVAVKPGEKRFALKPPVATDHGRPITGKVAYEVIVDALAPMASFAGIGGLPYPFAKSGAPDAQLSWRDRPEGERRPIAHADWSFAAPGDDGMPQEIALKEGFRPGRIYELTYTAKDPVLVGLGMVGIRDLLSYLGANGFEGAPAPAHTLTFGVSQSGRLLKTMILRGLHVDEAGKKVFDGAFIHVAGGGMGGFDGRFAMPTRHFSVLQDHIYPTDYFPFTTTVEYEPLTGAAGSFLDRAHRLDAVPKLVITNDSTEYWNRAAALAHTTPDGTGDVPEAPEARIYLLAGAQHYVGRQHERGIYDNCVNTLDHYRVLRALMVALDGWVRDGTPPPPSTHPRVADGTLVPVDAYKLVFPQIPGLRLPESNLNPPRLDFGPRYANLGIADIVPPRAGPNFTALVPEPNADGIDQGGIELPEVLVPLGTRLGFNTRNEAAGFPWATGRWDGSFIPFARTEAEREASGDPRPSLAARYRDRADYEQRLRQAAARVVGEGFLPADEVDLLVKQNGDLYDRIMAHDPADRSCAYLFPS